MDARERDERHERRRFIAGVFGLVGQALLACNGYEFASHYRKTLTREPITPIEQRVPIYRVLTLPGAELGEYMGKKELERIEKFLDEYRLK